MKKLTLIIAGAALLFQCHAGNNGITGVYTQKSPSPKGTLTISSTPDLFDLTSKWANDYTRLNPEMKISVVSLPGLQGGNLANSGANLAFVSNDYGKTAAEATQWKMVIGRDVIVPVINTRNPLLSEIVRQGISAVAFARIFSQPDKHTWANLLDNGTNTPFNFYFIDNESIKSTIAGFVSLDSNSISGIKVAGGAELVAAIQNDPEAIGFCRLADITDPSGENLVENISLLPIDKNANGRIDYIESIYGNVNDLSRGIWIGKYPKALCRNLSVCSLVKPTNDNEIAFLKYVLTSGQQLIDLTGYRSMVNSERLSKLDRLPATFLSTQTSTRLHMTQILITILAGILFIIAVVAFVLRFRSSNKPVSLIPDPLHLKVINENTMEVPKGLWFDKTHTWAYMEIDGAVKVGIDDFLQHVTGPITSIKLKRTGDRVKKGEHIMTIIQKGKRLNISAPISGVIMSENLTLFTDPSLINSAPYTTGWIYQIEPTNWSRETQFLFMAEKYAEWIKSEFLRLKDFLAMAIKPGEPEYAYVILQDGGEITDHLLENFGPEVWEEFQTKFIDSSK